MLFCRYSIFFKCVIQLLFNTLGVNNENRIIFHPAHISCRHLFFCHFIISKEILQSNVCSDGGFSSLRISQFRNFYFLKICRHSITLFRWKRSVIDWPCTAGNFAYCTPTRIAIRSCDIWIYNAKYMKQNSELGTQNLKIELSSSWI